MEDGFMHQSICNSDAVLPLLLFLMEHQPQEGLRASPALQVPAQQLRVRGLCNC